MEVKRRFLAGFLVILSISCAQNTQKTPDNVFESSKNKSQSNPCSAQAIENQFIIHWEDGHFSHITGQTESQLKDGLVTDKLSEIKKVYYDRKVQFYSKSELENSVSIESTTVTTADYTWGQKMVHADAAWNKSYTGQGVVVGIVDSYVDTTHPQLKDRVLINTNEIPGNQIDDDGNGVVDDYEVGNFTGIANYTIKNEHGTHVAGIISSNHSGNMKGIAPDASIIPAPFISNDGSGSLGDAIQAMNYVVSRGAKVINASWGGSVCVTTLKDAFQEISKKGVIVVVAAGNEGRDLDLNPTYPAAFSIDNQITVGASNMNDYMTSFSNSSFNLVHLSAPGDNIYSTTPNDSYNFLKGTSMAAPFVTGAVAILMSAVPTATPAQIKEALINSVDVTPNHEFRVVSRGRLNIEKALSYLGK